VTPELARATWGERLLMAYARSFPVRRGKLRMVNSLWRPAAGKQGPWRVAQLNRGGFRMRCDLRDMLQRQFYFFGTYFLEDEILRCWSTAAKGARTVFDVGANAGIYSLAALAVEPEAEVHAFEPTPEIAARLRGAAELNGLDRLHVHEEAVFSADGSAVLQRFRGETGDNEGMNFITTDADPDAGERVATVRLDSFCRARGIDRIDLVKIDVQGHEPSALVGAQGLLDAAAVGVIFMELNWSRGAAASPAAESIALLQRAGYVFSRPTARMEWREAGDWLHGLSDIVARRHDSERSALS
jgi:FkbM family methyltransferase